MHAVSPWLALAPQSTLDFLFTAEIHPNHWHNMCIYTLLCSGCSLRVLKDAVVSDTPSAVTGLLNPQHCYRLASYIAWMLYLLPQPLFTVHVQFECKTCCKAIYQGWHFVHIQASGWSRSDLRTYNFLSGMLPYIPSIVCLSPFHMHASTLPNVAIYLLINPTNPS